MKSIYKTSQVVLNNVLLTLQKNYLFLSVFKKCSHFFSWRWRHHKALVALDILTHNIKTKRYEDKKCIYKNCCYISKYFNHRHQYWLSIDIYGTELSTNWDFHFTHTKDIGWKIIFLWKYLFNQNICISYFLFIAILFSVTRASWSDIWYVCS